MNYLFLKNILESIFSHFHCPECGAKPIEQSLDITKISEKNIELTFHCQSCQARAFMKAELGQLTGDFLGTPAGKDFMQKAISQKKFIVPGAQKPPQKTGISAEEIAQVEDKLSANITIESLINGDEKNI